MADPTTTRPEDSESQPETVDTPTTDAPGDAIEEAEIVEDTATEAPSEPAQPVAAPAPEQRRGPGFVPLLLGGVIAAGLGYGAAYMGMSPATPEDDGTAAALAAIQATLAEQGDALTALGARAASLEDGIAAIPPAAEPVDLTPLGAQIEALGARIDATGAQISGLMDRIAYLETLPLGEGGEGGDNSAALAAAVAQMQAALQEQTASLAEQQAANAAMAEELLAAASAAEDRIAAAQAQAEARVAVATAQAALGQLRIAVATGAPFAGALQDVAAGAGVDVPETLTAAARTGVPTLEELQASFPAAARAALAEGIRETAGEGVMDRMTAFVQSQVGGRSLEPQEGDDPDAVLSRAEAALREGDVAGAVAELSALPAAAQAALAEWTATAETRIAALEAMDSFAAALDAAN